MRSVGISTRLARDYSEENGFRENPLVLLVSGTRAAQLFGKEPGDAGNGSGECGFGKNSEGHHFAAGSGALLA